MNTPMHGRPGIGELIEQLQRVKQSTEQAAEPADLAEEVTDLAELLQSRLDHLVIHPQLGEEMLNEGQPPNLDLFSQHPQAFHQCMAENRLLVLEEVAYWREMLEDLSHILAWDGKKIAPTGRVMQAWLNRLEKWLKGALDFDS